MKHKPQITTFVLAALTLVSSANAQLCGPAFKIGPIAPEVQWRKHTTQFLPNGEAVPSSGNRERSMEQTTKQMEDFILNFRGDYGIGDIPPMRFFAAEGARVRATSMANGLGGTITKYVVSGVGAKAAVEGTLLLPVSGHQGNANARAWATTDLYDVRLDSNPNQIQSTHHSYGKTGKETTLVKNAKSLDLVTKQEVSIPLIANVPVVVLYYRKGSAGPAGYIEGRVMEFLWDGT